MSVYSVRGFTGTFTAANPRPIASLWNPDAGQRLRLIEVGVYLAGVIGAGTGEYALSRISTEGTPASTVTPDADNAWDTQDAPASGARLNLGQFTANPTLVETSYLVRLGTVAGSAGQGMVWTLGETHREFVIKPGQGIEIRNTSNQTLPNMEVYFVWEES